MLPRRLASSVVALFSLGAVLLLLACERGAVTPHTLRRDPGFYDYTTGAVTSLAELRQLAAMPPGEDNGAAISGTKFVISSFSNAKTRELRFLDGRYYYFHDEWAWFRLLNGQPVPGMAALELHPHKTPEEARRWALKSPDDLPAGLKLTDERLYAPEFYERSLAHEQRDFGAGSLIYVPARSSQPALWAFELDYGDPAEVADVLVFFELLEAAIPEAVSGQLKWITRSPAQLEIAKRLVAAQPRFKNRVMSYEELSVPGETVVYTPGIVAGRLEVFRYLSRLAEAKPDSILLLGALPEYLPQARGLVSAVPQTPLAHLNLLAKNRQIVNAYRGGLLEDPEIQNLARSGVPVVLSAEGGTLRFQQISEAQYSRWLNLKRTLPVSQAAADVSRAPYIVDLAQVQEEQLPHFAPWIGGKAVGMVHLLRAIPGSQQGRTKPLPATGQSALNVDVPDRPLAITVRAYREHLEPLLPSIRALLADPNFQQHRKLRILALEGVKKFKERFHSDRDSTLADSYALPRSAGPIAEVVRQGGLQQMIRKAPLPEAVRRDLELVLPRHFASYSSEQGLRFRSSSTVEDIEGSSGAGLYDSATGYLVPRKAGPSESKRASVADALRKTWASYFSVEAFEERHSSQMDHLAADMAVLVHARFDDALELANGVFTFTQSPSDEELAVDAQPGAISVTNPPTDRLVLPESSRVVHAGNALQIERETLSSEARPGLNVLSDAELRELFSLGQRLTAEQLALSNAGLPAAQQRRTFVMDFEFRRVKAGWPALSQGQYASRFVVKQMRPLEPAPRGDAQLRENPIPRDVLTRARRIERHRCVAADLSLEALTVLTDPNALPDLGYSEQPMFAYVMVEKARGGATVFTHLDQRLARLNTAGFFVELNPGFNFSRIEVKNQILSTTLSDGRLSSAAARCQVSVEYAEPREMLRSFLEAAPPH